MASCAAANAQCTGTCEGKPAPQMQACINKAYEGIPMGTCA